MSALPNFKGKVFLRNESEEYKVHAYQYATTSRPEGSLTPSAIVYVADDDDIKMAIDYARENNIGIAIRSGGHQYLGSSSTSGKNIQLDMSGREANDPSNYTYRQWSIDKEEGSLTLGVGLSIHDVDEICLAHSIFFPHGECSMVHLGGHTQTGGFSIIARTFGVMIDYLLSFDIILADGSKRTVRRESTDSIDQDLWYAVLGGSPGNLGIVTRITLRYLKDADHPKSRGIKMAWPLTKPTIQQLIEVINEINDDPDADPDFNLTVLAISAEHVAQGGKTPSFDEHMIRQYPQLVGETGFHWQLPMALVVGCWANSQGAAQDDAHVDKIFDRFRNVPGMIPVERMLPFLRENTLMDGRSYTPISRIFHNLTWENPRVLNLPYYMLTWFWKNTQTMSTPTNMGITVAEWLADKAEELNNNEGLYKNLGIKFGFQVGLLGGPGLANAPVKTALSNRDGNYWFAFDIFYDPNIPDVKELCKEYTDAMAEEVLNNKTNFWDDGRERRMILSPMLINDEKPVMDDLWPVYYDNRETYERILDIKRRLDPDHIFTANLFCVGATECVRFRQDVHEMELDASR